MAENDEVGDDFLNFNDGLINAKSQLPVLFGCNPYGCCRRTFLRLDPTLRSGYRIVREYQSTATGSCARIRDFLPDPNEAIEFLSSAADVGGEPRAEGVYGAVTSVIRDGHSILVHLWTVFYSTFGGLGVAVAVIATVVLIPRAYRQLRAVCRRWRRREAGAAAAIAPPVDDDPDEIEEANV